MLIYSNRGWKIRGAQDIRVKVSRVLTKRRRNETRERNANLMTMVSAASLYKSWLLRKVTLAFSINFSIHVCIFIVSSFSHRRRDLSETARLVALSTTSLRGEIIQVRANARNDRYESCDNGRIVINDIRFGI